VSNDARETGWQRFLDRLKQLWGRSRRSDLTPVSTAMAIARGLSAVALRLYGHPKESRRLDICGLAGALASTAGPTVPTVRRSINSMA
jgi:hypothetical protein